MVGHSNSNINNRDKTVNDEALEDAEAINDAALQNDTAEAHQLHDEENKEFAVTGGNENSERSLNEPSL